MNKQTSLRLAILLRSFFRHGLSAALVSYQCKYSGSIPPFPREACRSAEGKNFGCTNRIICTTPQMKLCKLLSLVSITLGLLAASSHGTLVVGGFNGDRVGIASLPDGYITEELRAAIATAFPDTSFVGTDLLNAGFLSTVDFLIVGAPMINGATSLSSDEQINLLNYVKGGGGLLIFSDNDEYAGIPESDNAAETFLDPFGVDSVGYFGGLQRISPVDSAHPLMAGPFGTVSTLAMYFGGWFDGFGPYATPVARYNENGQAAVLAIAPGALGPQSGGVVFISDGDILVNSADGGYIGTEDNKTFLLNAIAYTIPEPSVTSLGVSGLAVLASRRRRRG